MFGYPFRRRGSSMAPVPANVQAMLASGRAVHSIKLQDGSWQHFEATPAKRDAIERIRGYTDTEGEIMKDVIEANYTTFIDYLESFSADFR